MTQRTIRMIIEGKELVTAAAATTVSEAARLMKNRRVGAVMVMEDDRLVGVFTERDALFRVVAEERDARTTLLAEVMTPRPQTIHPDKPFALALEMMHNGRFRNVPVIEDDRLLGVVSVHDALGPELESFVYELLRQEQIGDVLA